MPYRTIKDPGVTSMTATSERVDHLINEDVRLLKVHVEGCEPQAFASAADLFARRK